MRRLAGPRHLAGPHLVEDLARLRVVPWVVRRGLEPGEHIEGRMAKDGMKATVSSAAMMLSRPNSVANHGIPAAR